MNLRMFCLFLATIWLCLGLVKAKTKVSIENTYSASTESMKRLLDVEEMLLENMEQYVNELKNRLNLVKKTLLHFRAKEQKMRTESEYLENPVNSFALLRHQLEDWQHWAVFLEQFPGEAQITRASSMRSKLPSFVDLKEASRSIDLLVGYYELDPRELAEGRLAEHSKPNTALSTLDCFALGKFNLFEKKYARAEKWLNVSLEVYDSLNPVYKVYDFDERNIHKWLAIVHFKRRQHVQGLHHLKRAEKTDFDEIIDHYETNENMRRLCTAGIPETSRLHCRYNNWMTPFLRLAPLKMEQLNLDPLVMLYHEVIYDSEIDCILNGPGTYNPSMLNFNEVSLMRTAKNKVFKSDQDAVTLRLHRRLKDMTGFVMKGSDKLSLINYGIGGHYENHMDAFPKDMEKRGNRIATTLFYLSEVELGGATVFTKINLTVKPKRGNALVWANLKNDGSYDLKSIHAACPVVVGAKYVLTKWIYSINQMFIKPCLAVTGKSV